MTDENIRAMPADEASWGDRERAYQNDMMLAFSGSGFVTAASGRVFVPLVGRPRSVPSRQAERDLAVLRQRHWARKLGIAIFVVGTVWLYAATSSFVSSDGLAVVAFVTALGTACLLEWRHIRAWAGASGLRLSRFEIIVGAMSNWPSGRLLIKLAAELLVGGFILLPWISLAWPTGRLCKASRLRILLHSPSSCRFTRSLDSAGAAWSSLSAVERRRRRKSKRDRGMPLFRDRLRADAADNPNRLSLLFFGTGFVDVPPGRVFLPLIGRQRWVPSKQDELAYWKAFPSAWLCAVLVMAFFCIWTIAVGLRLLPEIRSGSVWLLALIGAEGIWFWRRARLVRHWPLADPAFKRSKLVVASLQQWSVVPLSLVLALLVALGVWTIPDLLSGDEGAAPATADPDLWAPLAVLALAAFAYFRAIVWLVIALLQRVRRSGQAWISRAR